MFATIFGRLALGSLPALGVLFSLSAIQPASAATTEVFYQHAFDLTCVSSLCYLLPPVAASTKLNIRSVSCYFVSNDSSTADGILTFQFLPNELDSQELTPITVDANTSLFVQEMDVLLLPQKQVELRLTSNAGATAASCTLTGRLLKTT